MPSPQPWVCHSCLLRLRPNFLPSLSSKPNLTPLRIPLLLLRRLESTLTPALLRRARALAAEHANITTALSSSFSTPLAKRLGDLGPPTTALAAYDSANASLAELRSLAADSATDPELRDLALEDLDLQSAAQVAAAANLKSALAPRHPFTHLPCLLEIRPGAGGSEAALFAADLLRMYTTFCARTGLRASLLAREDAGSGSGDAPPGGPEAGALQMAVLEVADEGAYGWLRCEAGVHRVQRVPATESKGRIHTSAASVMVLPSFPDKTSASPSPGGEDDPDDPTSDYYVDPRDVRTEVMRARGAGGQHVNTTDSAVRLTHGPLNFVVSMQDARSQARNREKAWRVLRARVAQHRREEREREARDLRRSVIGVARVDRGDKVRTYNFGQQRVTDHRSGVSVHSLGDVLEGGEALEKVMESVRRWMVDREIEDLIAADEAAAISAAGATAAPAAAAGKG